MRGSFAKALPLLDRHIETDTWGLTLKLAAAHAAPKTAPHVMEMMYPPLSSSDVSAKTPWGNTLLVRTYPLPMYVPRVQLAAAKHKLHHNETFPSSKQLKLLTHAIDHTPYRG